MSLDLTRYFTGESRPPHFLLGTKLCTSEHTGLAQGASALDAGKPSKLRSGSVTPPTTSAPGGSCTCPDRCLLTVRAPQVYATAARGAPRVTAA
jgi:hypothetical protein